MVISFAFKYINVVIRVYTFFSLYFLVSSFLIFIIFIIFVTPNVFIK